MYPICINCCKYLYYRRISFAKVSVDNVIINVWIVVGKFFKVAENGGLGFSNLSSL